MSPRAKKKSRSQKWEPGSADPPTFAADLRRKTRAAQAVARCLTLELLVELGFPIGCRLNNRACWRGRWLGGNGFRRGVRTPREGDLFRLFRLRCDRGHRARGLPRAWGCGPTWHRRRRRTSLRRWCGRGLAYRRGLHVDDHRCVPCGANDGRGCGSGVGPRCPGGARLRDSARGRAAPLGTSIERHRLGRLVDGDLHRAIRSSFASLGHLRFELRWDGSGARLGDSRQSDCCNISKCVDTIGNQTCFNVGPGMG